MEEFTLYLFAGLGVLISIVLPLLRSMLPKPPQVRLANGPTFWEKAKPYLITAAFSLISGILIYAGFGDGIEPKEAIIAGYAWDSTLQKLRGGV